MTIRKLKITLTIMIVFLITFLSITTLKLLYVKEAEPSAIWYEGFSTFEEAQAHSNPILQKKGFMRAHIIYQAIQKRHPEFQPEIVQFKLKVIKQRILQL